MALTDSLQAYWKLDESSGNAADSSGNSNTLTNNNTIAYGAAKINNGADMETSSSQYYSITDAAQTGLDFSTAFTFAWWQKLESVFSGTTDMNIITKNSTANQISYYIRWNNQGTTGLDLFASSLGTGATQGQAKVNYTPGTGTFVHIVLTYNVGTMELFVNATSQGTATGTLPITIFNGTSPFTIGSNSSTDSVDGFVDEFGAWSRVLTGTEISSLYNSGAGLAYPFTVASTFNRCRMMTGVGM